MPEPAAMDPLLIPRPRSIVRRSGVAAPRMTERVSADAPIEGAGAEAYRIEAAESGIQLIARSPAGIAHARRALAQLRSQYGDAIPCLTVDDAPAYASRGVMLDVSRDRIPTNPELRRISETLASLGFNHIQLYTEHTFAYAGHEEVWRGWDPITPDEARALDSHCRGLGIELAANQNCFGHLASWLRHPRYADLAETHGEWVFEYNGARFPRKGPFSLCPTDPRSLALVQSLLDQLLPCFQSPLVNLGCDETYDVGSGRSSAEVAARGRPAVCAEFIGRICTDVQSRGRTPMFWADMVVHHPELMKHIGSAIALIWDYEPSYEWSLACDAVKSAGLDAWVCPGTSSWRSITGRTAERRANLRESAQQGLASGASGFLVTDWGDTGHHQQWPISLHALAEAADAAWTGGRDGYDRRAAALHVFGDRTLGITSWLDELGDADLTLREVAGRRAADQPPARLRNSSALFLDLHTPLSATGDEHVRRGILSTPASLWNEVRDRLRSLEGDPRWHSAPAFTPELRHTLDVALCAADRAIWRRSAPPDARTRDILSRRLESIIQDYQRLWLLRSRRGGLESSTRHYHAILSDLRGAQP